MKFIQALTKINEGTVWKCKKDAQAYCDTMKNVYGTKCKPVQVDKQWDYWEVEYPNQNKITESSSTPAEQVAKTATDSLTVSLNDSVASAVKDISNNIIGPTTKKIVADNLRDDLENFSKDIEDSENFVQSVTEQLEDTLRKSMTEAFQIEVKDKTLNGLSDLVNKEILKVQFKDEGEKFATN